MTPRLPRAEYRLHRTGSSQEDVQLLREGWQWHDSQGAIPAIRFDRDRWDENTVAAMDGSDGSDGGTACSLST